MKVEDTVMQHVIEQQVTVLPGGKIELVCPELQAGDIVEVVVSASPDPERTSASRSGDGNSKPRRSVLDILNDGPRERLFKTAKEVDDYIREERDSWDR